MVQRRASGLPARITFTRDFHTLLTGDLCRGRPLQIAYDPLRIVPAHAPIKCGEPARPVIAHARFRPEGALISLPLHSLSGIIAAPTADASRRASLVTGVLAVADDAERVSLWFTYVAGDGSEHRDDDNGATYRFRFPCQDLSVERAAVIPLPGGDAAAFALEVASVPDVERMQVRYRILGNPGTPAADADLVAGDDPTGGKRWTSLPLPVPSGAVVRFKLFYWVGGVRFKDDDGGHYFLAPMPDDQPIPPPPPALLAAARSWVW